MVHECNGTDSLAKLAQELGLKELKFRHVNWDVEFDSGHDVFFSTLIRETFLPQWLGAIPSTDREAVLRKVGDAIDTYWHGSKFKTSVEAVVLMGKV